MEIFGSTKVTIIDKINDSEMYHVDMKQKIDATKPFGNIPVKVIDIPFVRSRSKYDRGVKNSFLASVRSYTKNSLEMFSSGRYSVLLRKKRNHRHGENYPVLKVFIDDLGYLEYLKFCCSHQDIPHVPKIFLIYEIHISGAPKGEFPRYGYGVVMERLLPLSQKNRTSQWIDGIHSMAGALSRTPEEDIDMKFLLFAIEQLSSHLRSLQKKNRRPKIDFDIHGQNIMLRGNTYVITDPYVWDN